MLGRQRIFDIAQALREDHIGARQGVGAGPLDGLIEPGTPRASVLATISAPRRESRAARSRPTSPSGAPGACRPGGRSAWAFPGLRSGWRRRRLVQFADNTHDIQRLTVTGIGVHDDGKARSRIARRAAPANSSSVMTPRSGSPSEAERAAPDR